MLNQMIKGQSKDDWPWQKSAFYNYKSPDLFFYLHDNVKWFWMAWLFKDIKTCFIEKVLETNFITSYKISNLLFYYSTKPHKDDKNILF